MHGNEIQMYSTVFVAVSWVSYIPMNTKISGSYLALC